MRISFLPLIKRYFNTSTILRGIAYISEEHVIKILDWDEVYVAVERSMRAVSTKKASQPRRETTKVLKTGDMLLSMPGYFQDEKYGGLGCKMVTVFKNNPKQNIPSILAGILLFDEDTGLLKAVIEATELTAWRTAAASAVATKYLYRAPDSGGILAIIGIGKQGMTHAVAFNHYFDFNEIRLCNLEYDKAVKFAAAMNTMNKTKPNFFAVEKEEDCVRDADVIITTTFASAPVVKRKWVKNGVHINAVGAAHHAELDEDIYKEADIYVDCYDGGEFELATLLKMGLKFTGEIGELVTGKITPLRGKISVFQSLGMAVEDIAVGRVVYDSYTNKKL